MSVLVVAEKPSVARDIASVLGATTRHDGFLSGSDWVVTWAIGHLVALAEPHEINPEWKKWRFGDLPILPTDWPLVVPDKTREQFDVVRRLLGSKDVRGVVCATDAGREGELIFRYIYEAAKSKKPVKRLWISSLTPEAIASGFRALKDGAAFDRLADAARARSRADWLVGMNLSRAYSIASDDHWSVGRVQTPTLAMIVARELEIRAFVPEDYFEVVATFEGPYDGTFLAEKNEGRRFPPDGDEADKAVLRAKKAGEGTIASVDRQIKKIPAPQLYDLTELQRHANRLYGFTAQRTLSLAQTLYEERKLLSYPRTDSKYLSATVASTLGGIVKAIAEPYAALLAEGTGTRPLGRRFVDDARVTDHHAILPTEKVAPINLAPDERKIYDLVCRRLLSAWHGDHVFAVTNVVTTIGDDRYGSSGTSIEDEGWKVLDVRLGSAPKDLPGGLARGMKRRVLEAKKVAKRTRPPPRFSDAMLLTAMETAGRALDDREISEAMRERGLGTPATRAAILETLLRREYVLRDGKTLVATDKGVALVETVHPHVKSPAMTGEWEAKLARIESGEETFSAFMAAIERYVREVVGTVSPADNTRTPRPRIVTGKALELRSVAPEAPPEDRVPRLLEPAFGFAAFRPFQEAVCRAAASGKDVLLVMPTGAGKSLCYQLPGIARGGTTLVISPLIALMEDQTAQLQRRGFVAERIHSGRTREDARAACRAYLDGALDFLFIAPERLRVPGFSELLARRKPTLIAIDEAHCISQWGHDFRPDYRMLGERLPLLRPAPVIALTATATPAVQEDVIAELRLASATRFIHGFRRTNIGVEVVSRNPSQRLEVVRRLLADAKRRPAIVYAPTRSEAEEVAKDLSGKLRVAVYHAGLPARDRERAQAAFIGDRLDVIIATIAFGMGIDKPDVRTVIHTALPASVEGYYQEIGRAGRDGKPSRAVLLHSFVDTKTHEFFFERDYPETEVVAQVEAAIPPRDAVTKEALAARVSLKPEVFEKVLEKLWVHGGAAIDAEGSIRRGVGAWRRAYDRQRAHKRDQLLRVRRFAETASCRMLQLVAHFGDRNDPGTPCGICDVCSPDASVALKFREPTTAETKAQAKIIAALRERDGRAIGQLQRDVFDGKLDRRALDHILDSLARAGAVRLVNETFEKDGETISFQRVLLRDGDRVASSFIDVPPPTRRAKKGKFKRRRPKKSR